MKARFEYATEEDLPAIVATYNATIPSRMVTADLEEVSVDSKREWFMQHHRYTRPLWVVYSGDDYAGWMSFTSFYGRPAYSGTAEVSIYLEEKFRGRGLGRQCLEKAVHEAPGLHIHTLLGFIFGHNVASVELFKKCGFEKWGDLPRVANMDGTLRDLLILGKKLKRIS
jgi:phosphinothricin acetyltransferase